MNQFILSFFFYNLEMLGLPEVAQNEDDQIDLWLSDQKQITSFPFHIYISDEYAKFKWKIFSK